MLCTVADEGTSHSNDSHSNSGRIIIVSTSATTTTTTTTTPTLVAITTTTTVVLTTTNTINIIQKKEKMGGASGGRPFEVGDGFPLVFLGFCSRMVFLLLRNAHIGRIQKRTPL